jgi:hypothetical protein
MGDFVQPGLRHGTPPGSGELVTTLNQHATLAATLANPDISLARAAATYLLFKRKRLTPASERGPRFTLEEWSRIVSDPTRNRPT